MFYNVLLAIPGNEDRTCRQAHNRSAGEDRLKCSPLYKEAREGATALYRDGSGSLRNSFGHRALDCGAEGDANLWGFRFRHTHPCAQASKGLRCGCPAARRDSRPSRQASVFVSDLILHESRVFAGSTARASLRFAANWRKYSLTRLTV